MMRVVMLRDARPQVAFNPKVLLPLSHIGEQDEFRVQDASSFCALDERLSYWELLVRTPRTEMLGFGSRSVQRDCAVQQHGLRR